MFQIALAWDKRKADTNRVKHGIDFAMAAEVLRDPMALSILDQEHGGDEERWFTLGATTAGQLLAVSHTWQEYSGIAYVRIISAREATRHERRQYQDNPV
ncbi:hypothetical protein CCR96_00970 [Halochromatium roseum]|nr:hypothetical protein [Halochromatium roseum]